MKSLSYFSETKTDLLLVGIILLVLLAGTVPVHSAESPNDNPIKQICQNGEQTCEYYVRLPQNYHPQQTYWGLVTAHGGGGNGKDHWLGKDMRRAADLGELPVIVISPSFPLETPNAQQFPILGGTSYLKAILQDVKQRYSLHPKILLSGSSRGGQFAHRFALGNPELVAACVPIAAGTWTTPEGRFLLYSYGEVKSPETFLTSSPDQLNLNPKQHILFTPEVAKVAGMKAAAGVKEVPFLVICGTRDPRLKMAKRFATLLKEQGFKVETLWTNTKHGGGGGLEDRSEYFKYSQTAIQFFHNFVMLNDQ